MSLSYNRDSQSPTTHRRSRSPPSSSCSELGLESSIIDGDVPTLGVSFGPNQGQSEGDDLGPPREDELEKLPRDVYARLRRYYAEEIKLVKAFGDATSRDLGYNLLGYFREKRKQYDTAVGNLCQPWDSKLRWIAHQQHAEYFALDRWTAWPLHPDRVPSSEEWRITLREGAAGYTSGDGSWHDYKAIIPQDKAERLSYASSQLEEGISAVALSQAREQVELRQQSHAGLAIYTRPATFLSKSRDSKCLQCIQQQRSCGGHGPPDPCVSCTAANAICSWTQVDTPHSLIDLSTLEPVLDESVLNKNLQHSARAVIGKLETVLDALKASRSNQLPRSMLKSKANAKRRKTSRRIGIQSKLNKALDATDVELSEPAVDDASDDPSHATDSASDEVTTAELNRIHRPNLRDWSDVLSLAASVGWSPVVLRRVGSRCAELFGERMDLTQIDFMASSQKNMKAMLARIPPLRGWDPTNLLCPHNECEHNKHRLDDFDAMIEHIQRVHGWDPLLKPKAKLRNAPIFDGVHVDGFMTLIEPRTLQH